MSVFKEALTYAIDKALVSIGLKLSDDLLTKVVNQVLQHLKGPV